MGASRDQAGQLENKSTILFDLDGTILHLDPPGLETFHNFIQEMGVQFTRANARKAERWVYRYWAQSPELLEDTERFGPRDNNGAFWRNHARRHLMVLGVDPAEADALSGKVTEWIFSDYRPTEYVPEEIFETIQLLSQRGYYLGIVSNRNAPLKSILEQFGMDEFIEVACAAGEVGYWKPDPRIFMSVAAETGIDLRETVYVGDNFYADVRAARSAGLTPILFDINRLFPQAKCLIIRNFSELQSIFS